MPTSKSPVTRAKNFQEMSKGKKLSKRSRQDVGDAIARNWPTLPYSTYYYGFRHKGCVQTKERYPIVSEAVPETRDANSKICLALTVGGPYPP